MADLMLRCYTNIIVTQTPRVTDTTPRNTKIRFSFCNTWEGSENWTDLTNKGKLILPRNVWVKDAYTGQKVQLSSSINPKQYINNLFRRGDKVEIASGYYRYDGTGREVLDMKQVFSGFISKVESKQPITLELEDAMWQMKQIPCKPQTWPKTKTVEELMNTLLAGTPYTVNALTQTTVGDLIIQDETVAQLLGRLRHHYHLEAYFYGNELRIGSLVYVPPSPPPNMVNAFVFQKNIISDELTFQRKDDVKLSAVCESLNTVFTGKTNKKGQAKTKQERLTVLVTIGVDGKFSYIVKQKNVDLPPNEEGERRSLFFPNVEDAATLAKMGADELIKYYYEGFKGTFTTFAIPDTRLGDYIKIVDIVLPDRAGYYVVKGVEKSGGIAGGRQKITLAYKLINNNNVLQQPSTTPQPV